MKLIRVPDSDFISAIGYDSLNSMFYVEMFKFDPDEGLDIITMHTYSNVPPDIYDTAIRVLRYKGSMGVFYNSEVRGKFRGTQVTD